MKKTTSILFVIVICLAVAGHLLGNNTTPDPQTVELLDTDLGSKLNPVRCDKEKGVKQYLERLRCKKGQPVLYERTGHGGPNHEQHYLDRYMIKTSDGSVAVEIYMDMYYPGHCENRPIKGFKMAKANSAPRKVTKPAKGSKGAKKGKTGPVKGKKKKTAATTPGKKVKKTKVTVQPGDNDPIPGFDTKSKAPSKKTVQATPRIAHKKTPVVVVTPPPVQSGQDDKIPGFDDVAGPGKTAPVQYHTFVSLVPVVEPSPGTGKTKKKTKSLDIPAAVDEAAGESFKKLKKTAQTLLVVDEKGHTLRDKNEEVNELYAICTGTEDPEEKLTEIAEEIMEPEAIDLVVAGTVTYETKTKKYIVTPFIISKPDNKIMASKSFDYPQKIKADKFKDDLEKKLTEIIGKEFPAVLLNEPMTAEKDPQGAKAAASPKKPVVKKIYVTIIPFTAPAGTPDRTQTKVITLAELLNEAIEEGVKKAQRKTNTWAFNAANHTIHDMDTTTEEFRKIMFGSKLSKTKKGEKLASEILDPNDVDHIVAARYKEDTANNIVRVHVYIISKDGEKIFPLNLFFPKNELLCEEPGTKKKILCKTARANLTKAVRNHLEKHIK